MVVIDFNRKQKEKDDMTKAFNVEEFVDDAEVALTYAFDLSVFLGSFKVSYNVLKMLHPTKSPLSFIGRVSISTVVAFKATELIGISDLAIERIKERNSENGGEAVTGQFAD